MLAPCADPVKMNVEIFRNSNCPECRKWGGGTDEYRLSSRHVDGVSCGVNSDDDGDWQWSLVECGTSDRGGKSKGTAKRGNILLCVARWRRYSRNNTARDERTSQFWRSKQWRCLWIGKSIREERVASAAMLLSTTVPSRLLWLSHFRNLKILSKTGTSDSI